MSDCFDHMADAWDQRDAMGDNYHAFVGESRCNSFIVDPLYYHYHLKFDKLIKETDKAILIRLATEERWIPKSICKKLEKTLFMCTLKRCEQYLLENDDERTF